MLVVNLYNQTNKGGFALNWCKKVGNISRATNSPILFEQILNDQSKTSFTYNFFQFKYLFLILVKMVNPSRSGLPAPTNYRNQECVLYGIINESSKSTLIQLLSSICDPGKKNFSEHEMVFNLSKLF
jgi:hypothetical protein